MCIIHVYWNPREKKKVYRNLSIDSTHDIYLLGLFAWASLCCCLSFSLLRQTNHRSFLIWGGVNFQFELLLSDFLVRFRTFIYFFFPFYWHFHALSSAGLCAWGTLFSCHHYVYLKRQFVGTSLYVQPLYVHNTGVQTLLCAEGSAPLQKLSALGMSHVLMPSTASPVWYSESLRDMAQMVLVWIHVGQENQIGTFNWPIYFFF